MSFFIGFPTLNRYDLLIQSIASIRAGTAVPLKFLIIDNGGGFNSDSPDVWVYRPGKNLGVAASWNKLMELSEPTPVIICNDDLVFSPDTMAAIMAVDGPFISPEDTGYGCFRLSHQCWRDVGVFDENFWPAYHEDNDHHYRLRLANVPITLVKHGGVTHLTGGSSTIKQMNPSDRAEFDKAFAAGQVYYRKKWGGSPGAEIYSRPFISEEQDMGTGSKVMMPIMSRDKTWDKDIWLSVVEHNEYKLPEFLDRADVILDIGAHIGGFSQACLQRGAGHVYAVEPDPSNFAMLEVNLGWWGRRVTAINKAAWRSDDLATASIMMTSVDHPNTGSTYVNGLVRHDDGSWGPMAEISVPSVPFDLLVQEIIDKHACDIALCKLDCEKSEFPIIKTSQKLHHIKRLIGEYHECTWEGKLWTGESLRAMLRIQGFTNIEIIPHGDGTLGLFFADRG